MQGMRHYHRRVDEIQTQAVSSVGVEALLGRGIVLQSLAHLLAISCKHQTIHNQVFECRFVEESGGEDHESVEPPAGLTRRGDDDDDDE